MMMNNSEQLEESHKFYVKQVFIKISMNEKRLLKKLGLKPKEKTGNLYHYMRILDENDCSAIMRVMNRYGNLQIHEGMIPFLNRKKLLDILNFHYNHVGLKNYKPLELP